MLFRSVRLYENPTQTVSIERLVYGSPFIAIEQRPITGSVKGIQHNIYATKDDAGPRQIAPLQRSQTTDYPGTAVVVPSSYSYIREMVESNPADPGGPGNPWTVAAVNAAEFGYRIDG